MSTTHVGSSYMLFFSDDTELLNSLRAKLAKGEQVNGDPTISAPMEIIQETLHIDSFSESDILLYDIDLAKGNVPRIIKDLRRLKKADSTKPLVLIGDKQALNDALKESKISRRISRSFAKPVIPSQVLMAIDMTTSKNAKRREVDDQESGKKKSNGVLFGAAAAVLIVAVILGWFVISKDSKQVDLGEPSIARDARVVRAPQLDQDTVAGNPRIDALNAQALLALEAGQVFSPREGSALHYFERVLEVDSYNSVAYNGRQKIIDDLRLSFPDLLSKQELDEAAETIDMLSELEPFSDDNAKMRLALEESRAAKDNLTKEDLIGGETETHTTIITNPVTTKTVAKTVTSAPSKRKANRSGRSSDRSDGGSNVAQRLKIEKQRINEISTAIASKRLIPPQKKNAYTLLLAAFRNQDISANKLSPVREELLGTLFIEAQKSIDANTFKSAQKFVSYAKRLQQDNPNIAKLEQDIRDKRAAVARANAAAVRESSDAKGVTKAALDAAPVTQIGKVAATSSVPVLIKRIDAEYPRRAFNLDIEGWVELEYQVDQSGRAVNIRVLAEEPKRMFTKAATKALKAWQFEPAKNSKTGDAILSAASSTKFNFALGG